MTKKYTYTKRQRQAIADYEGHCGFEVIRKGEVPFNELASLNARWIRDAAEQSARCLEDAVDDEEAA